MKHECKITVIDKKCFTDFQEKYLADPKSGPCPFFNVGDEFICFPLVPPYVVPTCINRRDYEGFI